MAENLTCQTLTELKNTIKTAELNSSNLNTNIFMVIGLHRGIIDPAFISQTTIHSTSDVFDVILSDSHHKMKSLLHDSLNYLVQQYKLYVGCKVKIKKASVRFDETDLESDSLIILEDIEITGQTVISHEDVKDLVWYPDTNLKQIENKPLACSRSYYVDVWSTGYIDKDTLSDLTVVSTEEDYEENRQVYGDYYCIKDICKKWKSLQGSKPAIVVRVLRLSRLFHYGRPSKTDKWPFQLHVLIGDQSGCCTAVLWNVSAVKYLKILEEGKCLLLQNFTVKKSYHDTGRWKVGEDYDEIYGIEININPHHPVTVVKHINPTSIQTNLLPDLQHNFITRRQLRSVYDNVMCDIVGYVQFVGRIERELMKNRLENDSGCYWIYRWIHVIDHTTYKPIRVHLYRTNQYDIYDNIKSGDVVILKHLRVIQDLNTLNTSKQCRYLYLSSTAETQLSVYPPNSFDNLLDLYCNQPIVTKFIQWYRTNQSQELLHCKYGGYYVFPPLPDNITSFRKCFPGTEITNSSMWEETMNKMVYRQHVRLYIHALLGQIQFVSNSINPDVSKAKKSKLVTKEIKEIQINDNWKEHRELYNHIDCEHTDYIYPCTANTTDLSSIVSLPATTITSTTTHNDDELRFEFQTENYFRVMWVGLNVKIAMTSIKMCGSLLSDTSFSDILTGSCDNDNDNDSNNSTESDITDILRSAEQLKTTRYLIAIDLYRHKDSVEIMLNKAYPL